MEQKTRIKFGELISSSIVRVDQLYVKNGKDYKVIKKVKLTDYIDYSEYIVQLVTTYMESEVNDFTNTTTVTCGIRVYIYEE